MIRLIFVSLLLFELILVVEGSHFLGGTITWRPLNASATGTLVAVVIKQTYIWSYSRMPCTNTMITNNQLVPVYGSLATDTLDCIANCGSGSVGYVSPNVIPFCTDSSVSLGISVGQRSDTVYLQTGDDFSVAYQSTAWRVLATAASAAWSVSSTINVEPRSDNGLYNNAPVATVMSPIFIPVNQPTVINVPVGDADGDTPRCRWANQSNGIDECAGVCPPTSLPPATVMDSNCTIIITGQTVGDWFAVAFMVEDFIDSTSTIPLSSIPVQFLVYVIAPPTCTEPPDIIGEPIEDSCILAPVGQTLSFQLIAINNCGWSVTIEDIATLSFPGITQSSLVQFNSTTYYKNLTWTPTTDQIGYQVMCAMAVDSQNSQSAQYCFKFYVSTQNLCFCPGQSCSTATTSKTTTTVSSTTTATTTTITTLTPITSVMLINSESTTSSSEPEDSDLIEWIVIGCLVGIPLLLLFILSSCLCWYYCCSCGIGRFQISDCQGRFEFYHMKSIDQAESSPSTTITTDGSCNSFHSSLSNADDSKINVWFDDEYTTKSIENKWSFEGPPKNPSIKIRTVRQKPRRVTIFSLPPGTSSSSTMDPTMSFNLPQMNRLPYDKKGINNTTVTYIDWTKKKTLFTED